MTATGELFLWGVGVFGTFKVPQKVISVSNPIVDVCLGGSSLGAALDSKGMLWTWGSNISGELGLGDNDPKVHPYPVMALKKKTVTQVSCGSSFIVALGSNQKKEIPGLRLVNLKKVTHSKKQHRRNIHNNNDEAQSSTSGGCFG